MKKFRVVEIRIPEDFVQVELPIKEFERFIREGKRTPFLKMNRPSYMLMEKTESCSLRRRK